MPSLELAGPPVADEVDGGRIPFRLRVGVVGHRRLEDEASLAARVRDAVEQVGVRVAALESTPARFTILSALAEGADRLIVREALDVLGNAGVELEAVLPLEVDDYVRDFESETSRAEFIDLLASASARTQMPQSKTRDEAYERAGHHIVDRSDVLIAIWDLEPARGRGGTAEVIDYARDAGVPVVIVPVQGTTQTDRWPSPAVLKALDRIDDYNEPSVDHDLGGELVVVQERLGEAVDGSPIRSQYTLVAAWALPHFVRADSLALKYQRRYHLWGAALYLLAAAAVGAIAAQWVFAQEHEKLAFIEVGLMLILLGGFVTGRRARFRDRWADYRSLAENFRSALFITLTGARDSSPHDGTDRGDIAEPWFQRAFSEAWRQRPAVSLDGSSAAELRRFLVEAWIDDQVRYHRNTAERLGRRRKLFRGVIAILFGVTVVVGTLHAFGVGSHTAEKWFVIFAITLPAFGAALAGIRDQQAYPAHEERHRRTADQLTQLKAQMKTRTSLASVQKLAGDIHRVIDRENLDWSGVVELQDIEIVI